MHLKSMLMRYFTLMIYVWIFFHSNLCFTSQVSIVDTAEDSNKSQQLKLLAVDLGANPKEINRLQLDEVINFLNSRLELTFFNVGFDHGKTLTAEFYYNILYDSDIRALRLKIASYNALVDYQWPELSGIEIKLGFKHVEVAKLRWMLRMYGDLQPYSISPYQESVVDPSITEALKAFQRRHGITATGDLNEKTLAFINNNPLDTLDELRETLSKHIVRKTQANEYIEVNLKSALLKVIKSGNIIIEMPVIVGRPSKQTPQLNTFLTRITVNPDWTPPRSIIDTDLKQSLIKYDNYLNSNNFVIVDKKGKRLKATSELINISNFDSATRAYKLVQLPGSNNALGKYRFSIPNSNSIYLHDTPDKTLFKLKDRALSHGCIRLLHPDKLASYLIKKETNQFRHSFSQAVAGSSKTYFKLSQPLPVHIVSDSIWLDGLGALQVRN